MGKYLTGSAKTGAKIIKNIGLFKYTYTGNEAMSNSMLYRFNWRFDTTQFGHISIEVKGNKMSNSSLIDTDSQSPHKFDRPLGLYNDSSLVQVFADMMSSVGISITGIYSEPI